MFPFLFAVIDRLWGAPKGKLPAKVLAVVFLLLAYWRAELIGLALAAGLVAGRSLDFPPGTAIGKGPWVWPRALAPAGIAALVVAYLGLPTNWPVLAAFVAFAVVTVALAKLYGSQRIGNTFNELARGFAGGAALSFALWWLSR